MNSMVMMFTFSIFWLEILFSGKFGQKNQNGQFKLNFSN